MFEAQDEIDRLAPGVRQPSLGAAIFTSPLALHPGAVRYYRERRPDGGNLASTCSPPPLASHTSMRPPMSAIRAWTIARPRPVPGHVLVLAAAEEPRAHALHVVGVQSRAVVAHPQQHAVGLRRTVT